MTDYLAKLAPNARAYVIAQMAEIPAGAAGKAATAAAKSIGLRKSTDRAKRGLRSDRSPPKPEPRKRDRDELWLERRRRKLREAGWPAEARVIDRETWQLGALCIGDRSGRALWHHLHALGNRAAVGAIRRAMFSAQDRRNWSSSYARHVGTLGLLLCKMSTGTRRKDLWRHGLKDISRAALCALLRDAATNHTPSISALAGTHRADGDLENGQIGYLRALEQVGLLYRLQRRRCAEDPTCNQYFLIGHSAYLGADELTRVLGLIDQSWQLVRPGTQQGPP